MKIALDLFPFLAFLATLGIWGIYPATAVLMVTLWVALALDYFVVSKKLNGMMLGAAIIASIFGVLTLALRDPMFIHIKPTVLFGLQSLAFLASHFIGEKVLLQRLMGAQLPLPEPLWRRISLAWVLFFALLALINLYTALLCTEKTWAWTLGALKLSIIPFLLAHAPFISPYLQDAANKEAP